MKKLIFASLMFAFPALADPSSISLAIPSAPQSYQSDSFRAGDLDCSNAIGSATQLEFGVTGVIDTETSYRKDVGVYGRITIPIGRVARERVNCNELYQLELKKKRLEVLKLEQELESLRALQFEN